MNKIRVIHLSIGLEWGGAENLMTSLVSRLDRARFEVKVVALQMDGPLGQPLREAGVPVITLDTAGRWDARAYVRLQRVLAQEKPNIVHAHLLRANLLACLTSQNHAVVWHDHCTGEWLNPVLRLLEKRLIVRSRSVIVVSNSVRDHLVARVPEIADRVTVMPNVVDARRFESLNEKLAIRRSWGFDADHLVVGFVGRLDERFKGVSYLLQSVAQLKNSRPNLRLVIVGGGQDHMSLEKLTQRLGIQESVVFLGSRADVHKLYPGFDVLAVPSLSEGFGIVLLEAMAASLPVVASRIGGIPEVVVDQETGLLVPPRDAKALAQALEELLRDPEKRTRMGKKGLERVTSRYTVESVLPQLEQIYSEITRMSSHAT